MDGGDNVEHMWEEVNQAAVESARVCDLVGVTGLGRLGGGGKGRG